MNDNDLLMQYITAIENPDSIGYSPSSKQWKFPTDRKKYDINQIGIGLDRNNPEIQKILKTGRKTITEQEERDIRTKYINGYLTDVWNRNTKGLKISPKKKMIAYGLLYNSFGPRLWNNKDGLLDTMKHGTDEEFQQKVYEFYKNFKKRDLSTRANNHAKFFKTHVSPGSIFKLPKIFRSRKVTVPFKKAGGMIKKLPKFQNPFGPIKLENKQVNPRYLSNIVTVQERNSVTTKPRKAFIGLNENLNIPIVSAMR